jgi:hypothetical protein
MAPSEGDPRDGPVGLFMTALTRFPKLVRVFNNPPVESVTHFIGAELTKDCCCGEWTRDWHWSHAIATL